MAPVFDSPTETF